jgi:hypothetical protein
MRKIANISLCLIMTLFIFFDVWANETKGPSLIILEPHYDAKEVQEGTVINHGFRLKNEGEAPLEIKRVNPG